MKISASAADRFCAAPDAKIRAVLVYGPDTGLIRERAKRLIGHAVEDMSDPFRMVEMSGPALAKDPPRLFDEAAAISLTGGRRALRITEAGDGLSKLFKDFLAEPPGDALVVLEAGELSPRSSLRKLFEGADMGAALPCYADEGGSLARVISETLAGHGLKSDADALAFLQANLGSDRMVTRSELDKLALYMGGPGTVTLADAAACIGGNTLFSLDEVAFTTASGDLPGLDTSLARAYADDHAPITVLRAVARHFQRLHFVAGQVADGAAADGVMKKLRPPVFFKNTNRFAAQVRNWPTDRLKRAMDLLIEAERDCKKTGLPPQPICARALFQIASAARAPARRPAR